MELSAFDYSLPEELIADRPLGERSSSRLLIADRSSGHIVHGEFRDLPDLLNPGDLLVFNDTSVIPARLVGLKDPGGARIEILLLREIRSLCWEAVAQRAIRLNQGTVVQFHDGSHCSVHRVLGQGRFEFEFHPRDDWSTFLNEVGEVPLPPYIMRRRQQLEVDEQIRLASVDRERYQTVYADSPGSAAAPTAGLHFDRVLLDRLEDKGIRTASVTLHVGLDTFAPITVDNLEDHQMHSEWCVCPLETVQVIKETKVAGGRIIPVGTTSCRTLEACASSDWPAEPLETRLFIKPGYEFLVCDGLLTNFHLPRSSLLVLLTALMGQQLREDAYHQAVARKYRFYSYGDAMLVL